VPSIEKSFIDHIWTLHMFMAQHKFKADTEDHSTVLHSPQDFSAHQTVSKRWC